VIDTEAPSEIELLSVSSGGCGGTFKVELSEWPSDVHTPFDRLVYAVYTGATREEAMDSPEPKALYLGYWEIPYLRLPWVAVSVLDQAGNESPRSEAVEITHPASGCSATGHGSGHPGPTLAALGLLLFAMRRRQRPA
jgi:MYXO-CTERM domain-containing protein